MLHLRQSPYSLSLVSVLKLLAMVAADEKLLRESAKQTDAAAHIDPEPGLNFSEIPSAESQQQLG